MKDLTNIEIATCGIEDYEEYLKMLNVSFEKKEENWFANYLPHIFPPVEKSDVQKISNNLIVKHDSKIVASIGIYPIKLVTEYQGVECDFNVGGIGSVCVTKEYRQKGLMSFMLQKAIAKMEEDGYELSWLTGDKFRYKNYGWDYSGKSFKFAINYRDILRYYSEDIEGDYRKATKEDITLLMDIHAKYKNRVIRSDETWKCYIKSTISNIKISRTKGDNVGAYMIFNNNNPEKIMEIQGDKLSVVHLIKEHMKEYNIENLTICYPYEKGELTNLLDKISSNIIVNHCKQMKIINVEKTWNKLLPMIQKQWQDSNVDYENISNEVKFQIIDKILSFNSFRELSPKYQLQHLNSIQSLDWWMSEMDMV